MAAHIGSMNHILLENIVRILENKYFDKQVSWKLLEDHACGSV